MTPRELPHAYPFRFVDAVVTERNEDFSRGTVSIRVSAGGRAAMGERWGSPLLLVEAIAQSALLLEGGDADLGRSGFLAGLEGIEIERPPIAGETLNVHVRLAGRFGAMARFEGEIHSEAGRIGRGAVLVRKGLAGEKGGSGT